jgi:hypothetical protein
MTSALSIDATARLDVTDNDLVILSSPGSAADDLAKFAGLIASGRAGGTWTGASGIISSAAALNSNRLTGLAILQNNKGDGTPIQSHLNGQPLSVNTILVKYTFNGDADISGSIDADDYFQTDSGFAKKLTGYRNGDFDLNSEVDADDYFLIDRAYSGQAQVLGTAIPSRQAESARKPRPSILLNANPRRTRHHRRTNRWV